jgi:hypothetical protein
MGGGIIFVFSVLHCLSSLLFGAGMISIKDKVNSISATDFYILCRRKKTEIESYRLNIS